MEEMYALFFGHVQGVGFRVCAQNKARELSLTGFVRNLPSGSVLLVAQGSKNLLIKLLVALEDRFGKQYEKEPEVKFQNPSTLYSAFQILR